MYLHMSHNICLRFKGYFATFVDKAGDDIWILINILSYIPGYRNNLYLSLAFYSLAIPVPKSLSGCNLDWLPGSCMRQPHPPVYKQTTLAAPCVCLMTTPNQRAVAQAVQSLPALHRLTTQLDIHIGESTLPPDPYVSFKYFDKYSHYATKLVICLS